MHDLISRQAAIDAIQGRRRGNMSEISETKMHHLICAFCDNLECVRGTKQCEFEQWKRQQAESEEHHD